MSSLSELPWEAAKQRAEYLHKIRSFFYDKGVIEVETPILSQGTVTDVHLEAFHCQFDFSIDKSTELYLQTSPEFAMKRLLASGYGSVYQIGKAFRHEEAGRYHNPEFTLLEWYRVGFNHIQLMNEVSELLQAILGCKPAVSLSYQQAFLNILNIDPLNTSLSALKQKLNEMNVYGDWIDSETDLDVLLQVLFSECIEKQIGLDAPCFIFNYPRSQASLARISEEDSRVAERFECYYQGIELANGFNELTDAIEQRNRFQQDNESRKNQGKTEKPIDQNFVNALTAGLPQCAGVALGIDRLMMLAMDRSSISETMTFTVKNA